MNFSLLSPALALAIIAIGVILIDLALPEKAKPALGYVVAVALLIPAALVVMNGPISQTSFSGTIVVDQFSEVFQIVFIIAAAVVILGSVDYVRRWISFPGEFYAIILFATLGATLLAIGHELITIYVALELTSISQYALAASLKNDAKSSESGLKYLLVGAFSSAALLYGMALVYGATGTTELGGIAVAFSRGSDLQVVGTLGIVLIVAGFGFKIAAVPFQMWVPDVYEGAPTPVTSFLSVASKLAGFVVLLRVFAVAFQPFDAIWPSVFVALAAITMTLGNLSALRQTNVKRLMGYSSIGQAGYALMGVAGASAATTSGLIFFLVVYALSNLGVFAAIIYFSNRLGSDEISDYNGLARRSPATALAMTLCLLSLVGLPPMAGFWSKVYLFLSVFDVGLVGLVVIGLLNSAVAAYYYLKIVHAMYLKPATSEKPLRADPSAGLALAIIAVSVLAIGLLPGPLLQVAGEASKVMFP